VTSLKGRATSLFAWGLLVGGVALLTTLPVGMPPDHLGPTHLPAAILFGFGGLVFGLSHPEGQAWAGGVFLGWLPFAVGVTAMVAGSASSGAILTTVLLVPGVLAGLGAWTGALLARRRS
jgi:hypothetical protein